METNKESKEQEPTKNLGGRPRKEIDLALVRSMCSIQCTGEEIAQALGISYDTLGRRIEEAEGVGFAEFFKTNSSMGKTSLRRMQWKAAQNGSVPMLIWLGKNILGQKDNVEHLFGSKMSITIDVDGEKTEKIQTGEIIESDTSNTPNGE